MRCTTAAGVASHTPKALDRLLRSRVLFVLDADDLTTTPAATPF
jgi:hypothetical protein